MMDAGWQQISAVDLSKLQDARRVRGLAQLWRNLFVM
jgi:hypothetical protein